MTEGVDMDVLFTCVQERPVLWDKSSEHYKDRVIKADAWRSVCEVLKDGFCDLPDDEQQDFGAAMVMVTLLGRWGAEDDEAAGRIGGGGWLAKRARGYPPKKLVIKRWINTRDQWVKRRREDRAALKSGAGPSTAKKYVYYDQLLFLERVPSRRKRATQTNTETTKGVTNTETTKGVANTDTTKGVTNTATLERVTNSEGAEDFSEESAIDEHLDANEPTVSGILIGHPKQKTSRTTTKRRRGLDDLESNTIKAPEGGVTTEDRHLMFFKGILPYLKSFSDTQALDFQMGVLQVIKNITTVNQTPSIQPNTVFGVDRHILHPPQFPKPSIPYPHRSSQYLQPPTPSSPLRQRRKSHKLEQFSFISVQEDMKDQLSVKKEPEVE